MFHEENDTKQWMHDFSVPLNAKQLSNLEVAVDHLAVRQMTAICAEPGVRRIVDRVHASPDQDGPVNRSVGIRAPHEVFARGAKANIGWGLPYLSEIRTPEDQGKNKSPPTTYHFLDDAGEG